MPPSPVPYAPLNYVRGQGIGELLRLKGQRAAEAELRRGDITSRLYENLGNQLSQSIMGYAKERQEAPIRKQEAEARTIGLQNARAEQAATAKATEDRSVLASAQGSGLEPDQVKAQLRQLGRADLVPIYEQTHANLETARLGLKEKKAAVAALENDYFGALAAGVKKSKYDPMAIDWALQQAEADGHDVGQIKQMLQQKPDALPQIIDSLIEKSPTQRKLAGEEADRSLKTQQEQRAILTQQQAAADREADNKRQDAANAEARRHNQATEARAAAGASDVTALSPEGMDMAALRYKMTGIMPALGMGDKTTRQKIINRSAELSPADEARINAGGQNIAANAASVRADSGSLAAMQKQRDAITSFEKTASKNIDIFLEQAGKVVDTGSPMMNAPARMFTGKIAGAPDQAAYDAARQVAINEVAKITSNPNMSGVLSDTARKEVEAFNPGNATLKQTVAVMRILKRDMANRTLALDETLAATRGRLTGQSAPKATEKADPLGIR